MKKILLFIGMLTHIVFYAQDIKQYSGDFNDGTTQHGKATYSYYLKNDERIKQGAFSYTRNVKSDEGSFNSAISGSFKNNFKDGNWSQTIQFTDWDNGTGNYVTGTITLISNYNNGLPNGQWIYDENSKSRIKKKSSNGYAWSTYTDPTSSKANMNFKNGVLNGNFLMDNFILNTWTNMKATFDEKGYFIKNLSYSKFREEMSVDYYKNTVIKWVKRNKSTGEVTEKSDYSPDEIVTLQKYSDGQMSEEVLKNNHFVVEKVKWLSLDDFKTNIYKSLFLDEYLKGDKVFDESADFGGYHIVTKKFKQMKLSEIEDMGPAESYMEDKTNMPHMEEATSFSQSLWAMQGENFTQENKVLGRLSFSSSTTFLQTFKFIVLSQIHR